MSHCTFSVEGMECGGVSLPSGWWVGAREAVLNFSLALVMRTDDKRRNDGLWVVWASGGFTVTNPGSAGATVAWGSTAYWSRGWGGMEMLSASLENKLQRCLKVHYACEHEGKSARKYRGVLSRRGLQARGKSHCF